LAAIKILHRWSFSIILAFR